MTYIFFDYYFHLITHPLLLTHFLSIMNTLIRVISFFLPDTSYNFSYYTKTESLIINTLKDFNYILQYGALSSFNNQINILNKNREIALELYYEVKGRYDLNENLLSLLLPEINPDIEHDYNVVLFRSDLSYNMVKRNITKMKDLKYTNTFCNQCELVKIRELISSIKCI